MTNTGQDPGAGRPWHDVSDAALANGMRQDADDATFIEAWREFDRRHLGHIQRFVEKRAGKNVDSDQLDDLLQETQLRIQKYIKNRGAGRLRSWCFAVADSVVKDLWRGHAPFVPHLPGATELVPFTDVEERYSGGLVIAETDDCYAIAGSEVDQEQRPLSEEESVMRHAFAALNDVDRAVLWCTVVHADSDAYVASITDKPVSQVPMIRYRAKEKLRKAWERLMAERRQAS
jgi:RNA polymerase sigma factor (sigma-70 family)